MTWNRFGQLAPELSGGDGPPGFERVCPFSPRAVNEDVLADERFEHAPPADPRIGRISRSYVGHVAEGGWRAQGSSGGMTSWVAGELLRQGLVDAVAHVLPADAATHGALFRYALSRDEAALRRGAKSRYYPIELSGVLREIAAAPGRYAVIGIPCFIKAVHLLRREQPVFHDRIVFTLGLFCGHMKSAGMVESFAGQMGERPEAVAAIDFRKKDGRRPANWYRAALTLADGRVAERDWWNLLEGDWGSGFFQHRACDFCDDVAAETADAAFGDAWVEPYSSDGRGTNVVVVRTLAIQEIIEAGRAEGRLSLARVDADFVVRTQAAGLRHRREGLSYRLTWRRAGPRPLKRVAPSARLAWRRKAIYRARALIAAGSHRLFALSRRWRSPALYHAWGRACLTVYHGLAYSRGPFGKMLDLVERVFREPAAASPPSPANQSRP